MIDIKIFLKGLFMGLADLIPGISGGTIAFITGIYERLILSIRNVSSLLIHPFVLLLRKKNKHLKLKNLKKDIVFLGTLITGIITALLLFSNVMSYLMTFYKPFVLVFFIGLVLSSSKIIFDHIEKHHTTNTLFALLGFIIGLSFIFIAPREAVITPLYILIGSFFASSAMFLPGISGSFILLLFGLYEFALNVLTNIASNLNYLLLFLIGIILGILIISQLVSFLFYKDKSKTLYVLLGIVIGSLAIPLQEVFYFASSASLVSATVYIILFLAGFFISNSITSFSNRKKKYN